jgi:predicted enzyme related to lactoylglutathione lyase
MVEGIDTVFCQVEDMDRATAFYRDVLGLEIAYASAYWTSFKTGATTLALHHRMDESPFGNRSNFLAILSVSDLPLAQAKLRAAGVWCADEFHDVPGGRICDFRDTEGNALQLIQRF